MKASSRIMLEEIYNLHTEWSRRFSFVCKKGCTACCTRSVTMTTLEGETIIAHIGKKPPDDPGKKALASIRRMTSLPVTPVMTTNHFASRCLADEEPQGDEQADWDFTPCPLLDRGCCSIYPVRPFGCRSLGSTVPCVARGNAVVPDLFFTVNTVFLQLIEHMDRHGGRWGNMLTVLQHLTGGTCKDQQKLQPARPLPGFLLQTGEQEPVSRLLAQLYQTDIGSTAFGELLFGCDSKTNQPSAD